MPYFLRKLEVVGAVVREREREREREGGGRERGRERERGHCCVHLYMCIMMIFNMPAPVT